MRIVSKQRDYYDGVQRTGQDLTLVYVRTPEEVHLNRGEWKFPSFRYFGPIPYWSKTCIIGFCGNIYPMIEMTYDEEKALCYSAKEVDDFLQRTLKKKSWERYCGHAKYRLWNCDQKRAVEFFKECGKVKSSFKKMFDDKQCPIFVAEHANVETVITYNALLRPYEFFRVMDPYTAFQEIAMFMSNFAVPQKPMPVIPDKMKIHSRGFSEWSFRKEPKVKKR